jgi:hypothetical protein
MKEEFDHFCSRKDINVGNNKDLKDSRKQIAE